MSRRFFEPGAVLSQVKPPKGLGKIIVDAFQVIGNMSAVFKLPLPPELAGVFNFLKIFQIDLAALLPLACLTEDGFNLSPHPALQHALAVGILCLGRSPRRLYRAVVKRREGRQAWPRAWAMPACWS